VLSIDCMFLRVSFEAKYTKIGDANAQFTCWITEQSTLSSYVVIKHAIKDRWVIRSDRCRKIFALTRRERRSKITFASRNKRRRRIALLTLSFSLLPKWK